MEYKEFSELPRWSRMQDKAFAPIEPDKLMWSGKVAPPAIGDKIAINFNNLGEAIVEGYFQQDGYLGVLVQFLDPPKFFVEQNGVDAQGHIFGAEIKE